MKRLSPTGLLDAATILSLLAAILTALKETLWVGIAIGGLAVVFALISWAKRHRERGTRRNLFDTMRDELMLDRILDAAARSLDLGGQNGSWRVSLYELDLQDACWLLRARAASNELFADRSDYSRISHEQSVLRSCLNGSERSDGKFDEMPPLDAPTTDSWATTMKAWGFTKTTTNQLRMKSRSFTGAVFKVGPQNGHQVTLGLIAESESPDGTNIRSLQGGLTRPFFEAVAELLTLRHKFEAESAATAPV
ncbi:hypothetical protein [Curtobacterium sp. MEB011]|uniref:hypothetical protein n=1 Tax=Curtobacterium sp. MEB011 TaxID=3040285 RepID=UPI00254F15CA|nr:hypothetical protein [Curtobacterium sp. MEB011]